jgi:nicotinate-nucleotide adenylyltransferase
LKIGLFGGSFDPIHAGHLLPVQAARRQLGLERVLYLPTAVPPHKPKREFAPAYARFAMVELALLGEEGLYASPFELTPDRPAYTIETLEHFQRLWPEAALHLLIGGDSYLDLVHWRRWREIVKRARLVVLTRPGWETRAAGVDPELAALALQGRAVLLAQPPVDLSSTRLRQIFREGGTPPPGTVPDLVVDYIRKYALYSTLQMKTG